MILMPPKAGYRLVAVLAIDIRTRESFHAIRWQTEKHELSHLYEEKIGNMGNAGRDDGSYGTRGRSSGLSSGS